MVKALGVIIGKRLKGRPRKRENYIIEKIECVVPILINKIDGEEEK